jgi:hypothetical protein
MREAAFKADPTMTYARHYIAVSRGKIAEALRAQDDLSGGLAELEQALETYRELIRNDSTNLELRRQFADLLRAKGETLTLVAVKERRREKWNEARALFGESLAVYDQLKANNQAFGSDAEKTASINAFIETQRLLFEP